MAQKQNLLRAWFFAGFVVLSALLLVAVALAGDNSAAEAALISGYFWGVTGLSVGLLVGWLVWGAPRARRERVDREA